MAEITDTVKRTALDVKRGVRTYSDLDEKTRASVRSYLRTATTRDLRKLVEAEPRRQITRPTRVVKIGSVRTF